MIYHILAVGDVVGEPGLTHLERSLRPLKKLKGIHFTVVNGENAAGVGILPDQVDRLYQAGADVVTLGNHTFGKGQILRRLEEDPYLLRPANFPSQAPGKGLCVVDKGRVRVAVINLMGTVYLESLRCPFETLDALLKTPDLPKLCVVDFHAEATGEKRALGFYADGRVTALFGTHTHVQTADERILPGGTAYLTDAGMCGGRNSVLGVKKEIILQKFITNMPARFEYDPQDIELNGVLITIDPSSGRAQAIERICLCD